MGASASSPVSSASATAPAKAAAGTSTSTSEARRRPPPAHVPASVITAAALTANDDVISPHLQTDLPHHIVECPLIPGSGRTMRSYRVRHVDTGAVIVVRAMVIKYEADGSGGGAGAGASGAGGGGSGILAQSDNYHGHQHDEEDTGSGTSKSGSSRLPTESQIRENLRRQEEELAKLRDIASDVERHPNVQTFLHWFAPDPIKVESYRQATTFTLPAYLLRPHVHSTLRDRLESRPFLSTIEKNWIAHQILRALVGLHGAGIRHGHLTCENVGVTSWGWVLLTDVASYKPVSVPDDDPSDFIAHYQERSAGSSASATAAATEGGAAGGGGARGERQRCYLAPERFFARREGEKPATEVTDAMDIFSAGCVLIEMYLNGERTFDLGDLMEYRRDRRMLPAVQQKLNKIESSKVRAACKNMLSLDPQSRLTAAQYLERLTGRDESRGTDGDGGDEGRPVSSATSDGPAAPMPTCFDSVLFPLLKRLRCEALSPDARIALAAAYYGRVVRATVGLEDAWGEKYFEAILGRTAVALEGGTDGDHPDCGQPSSAACDEQPAAFNNDELLKETEELLKRLEASGILSKKVTNASNESNKSTSDAVCDTRDNTEEGKSSIIKDNVAEQFNNITDNGHNLSPSTSAIVIFVELVRSSIRHVQRPSSKLVSLQLLQRLGKVTSDEVRLHRIVPSIVFLLQDPESMVRAAAISTLTSIVVTIKTFPPSDSQLFPQYIFKRVDHLASDSSLVVRDAFARSISVLAGTAFRFLDISHAIKMHEMVDGGSGGIEEEGPLSTNTPNDDNAVPTFSDDITNELLGKENATIEARTQHTNKTGENDNAAAKKHSNVLIQSTYDSDLAALRNTVSRWVVIIATDASETSSVPKRSLLVTIAQLCSFFGLEGTLAYVLPQVLAFLNDRRDWQLRALLCQRLPSICAVVGRASTAHFVIPCIETALVDSNETVVCCAISCLTDLIKMGLITRSMLIGRSKHGEGNPGIIEKFSILLVHPANNIRNEYLALFSASFSSLGSPDDVVFLLPMIRPFLRYEPSTSNFTDPQNLALCLLPPMSRERFEIELANVALTISDGTSGTASNSSKSTSKIGASSRDGAYQESDRMASILAIDNTKDYLEMLYRKKRASAQTVFPADSGNATDGASRYAYSCFVPNQKLAELMKGPLPGWYDSIRELERSSSFRSISGKDTNRCVADVSLRSLTTLGSVYGCSVTQPTTSSFKPKANYAFLDIMHGDDIPLDAEGHLSREKAAAFLESDESKSFGAAVRGEWGSVLHLDAVLTDNARHATNLDSMQCPPLPPSLGVLREQDGRPFSCHLSGSNESSSASSSSDSSAGNNRQSAEWKPKVDALVASSSPITEHNDAVVRLALSQDQSFFVSASHDGTCRVFELRQVEESPGDLRSSVVYAGHSSAQSRQQGSPIRINDVAMIEKSHSVASAASDGSVHVWRIDQVSSKRASLPGGDDGTASSTAHYQDYARVSGSSVVRTLNPREGEVLAVNHFNTDDASTLVFATQKGTIHSWDLRCAAEPFSINMRPELGYLTSMTVGHDRNFMVAGTNKGCLALFDVRYHRCVRLWQHSSAAPIARLAASSTNLRHDKSATFEPRPHVFMGCGQNEASVFDITDGSCKQCFRVLDSDLCYVDRSALPPHCVSLPRLHEIRIPLRSQRPLLSGGSAFDAMAFNERLPPPEPRILSLIGRAGSSGQPFLLTGGSDCCIRYWNLSSASKCYTVSGLSNCQPRPSCESINVGPSSKLYLCRQMPVATAGEMEGSKVPRKLERGQIRPENCHSDAILDLKLIDHPMKAVLSASRDGCVKVWR